MKDEILIEFAQNLLELYLKYRDNPKSDKKANVDNFMEWIQNELVKINR
jgi:hypothetical protein